MKTWKINEAKAKFSELLKAGSKSPQIIMNREKKIIVVISYDQFLDYQKFLNSSKKPTISDLLKDLEKLGAPDADFPEIERTDRKGWIEE